ncbi:hypothetical protein ACS0TY_029740 [Phlomoides rotata]
MDFSSALLYAAVALFFLFYYYLLSFRSKNGTQKAPPEAGGARPITGHLHLMGSGSSAELPHFNLAALADKHGPIFTVRFGVRRALVVSSWEPVKQLFTTLDAVVSSRPKLRASRHLGYDFALFAFSPYGPYWRELRKLVSVEFLSARSIELQRHVRVSETAQAINELYSLWEKKKDGSGRVLVDMKKWFGELNLNVVLKLVCGKRFAGGDDAAETRRCREVIRDFFRLVGMFVPADAFPCLGWLDIGGHEKSMKKTAKEIDDIVGGWLAEHREREYSGEGKPRDFMDVMLSAVQGASFQSQYDDDTIIKATCEGLIVGGTDTTTVLLVWALSLLLNNLHVLRRAQEELDEHVGRERRVNESDINNLVYLQAIAKETLRLYPPAPLSSPREFNKDCHVGGYHVPKGTWLIVNIWKLHRDPSVWSEEETLKFKPERFLGKNIDVRGQNFELIPFGAGRRICPGTDFGMHTLHLVLANLLQAFEFYMESDDKEVDMSESGGLTNMKATPLDVLVAPRLSPTLYHI